VCVCLYEEGWYRNPDWSGVDECLAPSWYDCNLSVIGWHMRIAMEGIQNAIVCNLLVRSMRVHVLLYMISGLGIYVCACVFKRICFHGAFGSNLRK